jgi:hypothetical protein
MTTRPRSPATEPMTIGNMRENGMRSLSVWCHGRDALGRACGHQTVMNVDHLPAEIEIPSIGPKLRCTACGRLGADARPNWSDVKR